MRCVHVLKGGAFACRQCLPCRIRLRREWMFRILMEAKTHAHTSFLTLTYDDDHLPADRSLSPEVLTKFLKRLGYYRKGDPYRYFAIGEYGPLTFRPHYHAALFGVPVSDLPLVHAAWPFCDPVRATLTPLLPERAQYLAGYVTKKMTKADDPRLDGRYPEFARMSRMGVGGIGAASMDNIASLLLTNKHAKGFLEEEGDVPTFLKTDGRSLPTGRYLRSKLREKVGINPQSLLFQIQKEDIQLQKFDKNLSLLQEGTITLEAFDKAQGFVRSAEKVDQMALNLKRRGQLNKKGRSI